MGFYKLKTGPSYKWKTGPSFCCFPQFYSFFWAFLDTQIVSQCVKIVFLQNFGLSKMRFSTRKLQFLFFVWRNRNKKKKKKWKRPKNPIKIGFFKVVIQKCEKSKKWIFSKNSLTRFVSGREKKRAFSCTLSVLAKMFFWTKTVQSRKHYEIRGFSGNC